MDKQYLKGWRLTLQSEVTQFNDEPMVQDKYDQFVPIQNHFVKIIFNEVNQKLTEEEFDILVAGLKEYYFSGDTYEKFKC